MATCLRAAAHQTIKKKNPVCDFLYFPKELRTVEKEIFGFRPSAEIMKMVNCGIHLWQTLHHGLVNDVKVNS